ncbi:hypothetical protein AABB24_037794 [Solanum stoloniferum]|uniref:Disease resistance protein At4g27190-like leucine-rich repeats domain-containing protein n=1 Tax=Solanum stoloniferum TaxID=62892 RepID=A0ABD2R640_9SOLN
MLSQTSNCLLHQTSNIASSVLRKIEKLDVSRKLIIENCDSMEEVITKGEGIMTVFPLLEELYLFQLPKLAHFFLTEHALEFPFLKEVHIDDCLEMKRFCNNIII